MYVFSGTTKNPFTLTSILVILVVSLHSTSSVLSSFYRTLRQTYYFFFHPCLRTVDKRFVFTWIEVDVRKEQLTEDYFMTPVFRKRKSSSHFNRVGSR